MELHFHLCIVDSDTTFKLLVEGENKWRDRPDLNRGLPTPQAGALSRLDYGPIQRGA